MCFSAEASFGASALLGTIGYFSVKKVQTKEQRLFAGIPLIFSLQQFTEGCLWIAFENYYPTLEIISTYTFLVIAQVIWPTFVPYAILLLEKEEKRKRWLNLLLLLGGIASVYLAFGMAVYEVKSEVDCYHIHYDLHFPCANPFTIVLFYVLPTIASLFVSSVNKMNLMGVLVVITLLVAYVFYTKYALSVWCFFAALVSTVILIILSDMNNTSKAINNKEQRF
ncbi:MAG: DUF6629 family protein [Bacteroidia bacterium]